MLFPTQYEGIITQLYICYRTLSKIIVCISIKLYQSLELLCQSTFALPMILKVRAYLFLENS